MRIAATAYGVQLNFRRKNNRRRHRLSDIYRKVSEVGPTQSRVTSHDSTGRSPGLHFNANFDDETSTVLPSSDRKPKQSNKTALYATRLARG